MIWQIQSAERSVIAQSGRPGPVLIDIPKDVTANHDRICT